MTRHTPVFGCVVGIVAIGDTFEIGEFCLDGLDEITIRNELLHLPFVAIERHVLRKVGESRTDVSICSAICRSLLCSGVAYLDKTNGDRFVFGETNKVDDILCIVQALDDNHVDLDTWHPKCQSSFDAIHHGLMTSPPRHELELERIERIERDVEVCESIVDKRVKLAPAECDTIGGDADLFKTMLFERVEGSDDLRQVGANGGFSTGQSDLVDALRDKERRETFDLGCRQQVG